MADLSDVMSVMMAACAGYVYPNGTAQQSVTGAAVRVEMGWPVPAQLDQDLKAGAAHVSIFPLGTDHNTTRYVPRAIPISVAPATLALSVSGDVVTVGGGMPSPFSAQNLAVLIGSTPFVYPIQPTDTLTSIATGLAALIAQQYPGTTSSGAQITLPAGASPRAARVGTMGTVATEWERQNQRMQITIWAPTPTARDQLGAAIKSSLAQVAFLLLPDGFGARILAQQCNFQDSSELELIYRRDLIYAVEYPTTVTEQAATVVALEIDFEAADGTPITATVN